jgi:ABC-type glycerol-3-phosphate transport system substrate-binding protein
VAFAYGKAAMYFGPSWRATEINKLNPNLRYKTVVLPQLRKEDPGEPDISYATYWIEGVSKRSASSDIAWDFLKFLSERESLIKLYDNQATLNLIGEPYPRIDMGDLLLEHPIIGSIIALAPNARSWYLADATFDGETGINSQLNILFEEVVRKKASFSMVKALVNLSQEVSKVLLQYGIRVR